MAVIDLRWREAVEVVCAELEQFQIFRRDGLSVDEAATAMVLEPGTAAYSERAITRLMNALKRAAAPAATDATQNPEGITS